MPNLVLLRHAERPLSHQLGSSALSDRGLQQADWIAQQVSKALPKPTQLISSPKPRALKTLEPLAERFGLKIRVDQDVDERTGDESTLTFENRVKAYLSRLDGVGVTYICSHADWLEAASLLLDSDMTEEEVSRPWSVADLRVFSRTENGIWTMKSRVFAP